VSFRLMASWKTVLAPEKISHDDAQVGGIGSPEKTCQTLHKHTILFFAGNPQVVKGTLLFVHGTGVRFREYRRTFGTAQKRAALAGIEENFVECAWGDPLGVVYNGLSLPEPPSERQLRDEEEDFLQWEWLFDGPLLELNNLTIPDPQQLSDPPAPGQKAEWETLWDKVSAYKPTHDLELLLKRGALDQFWAEAWDLVTSPDVTTVAFERSARELPEACRALARAVVAQLHVLTVNNGCPGPDRTLRGQIVDRLMSDWKQEVYAPSDALMKFFTRAVTRVMRHHRNELTDSAALPIGDILLYQSRGSEVREYIRTKIANAERPVTVVAHSLGGIACFDLLALPNPPVVDRLVTVGSQVSLLYEIGALFSLKWPQQLPDEFPPWLNIFDRNDFLSYVVNRLFPGVREVEVYSGQGFPESHSAYFVNDQVWASIRDFR
jgi:hypothetical protein